MGQYHLGVLYSGLAQLAERHSDKMKETGSIPVITTVGRRSLPVGLISPPP